MTDALDDFNTALKLDPRDGSALSGLFAHDDQWVDKAVHSGWLQKRGQVNTDFKKRYFLLHGAQLTYYDGEEAAGGVSGKGTTRTSNMKGQLLIDSVAHARASDAPEVWMKDGLTLSEQLTLGLALRISSPDGKDVILLCESDLPDASMPLLTSPELDRRDPEGMPEARARLRRRHGEARTPAEERRRRRRLARCG